MKDHKVNKLFRLARRENPPPVSEDFARRVMQQIRRDGLDPISFLEQMNALFPRLALTAVVVIVLCAGVDVVSAQFAGVDLNEGIARISCEWLLL